MGIWDWLFGKSRRAQSGQARERLTPHVLDLPNDPTSDPQIGNLARATYHAFSLEDHEKIDRIVRKLHRTMRQAGEQGLPEEIVFDKNLYEQMKADEKDLDRLLLGILIKLYGLAKSTLSTSDRMDLAQFVAYFNERTGAKVLL